MMLEDRFFDQEWVQEMSNEDFRMLMYLMHFASKKCGIVELNMRMINFAANTGRLYTQDEVLERYSNMLKLIPGKTSTAIFPNWIATNWAKGGKPIDTDRNPLFKSVIQELASYGLTIDSLNAMAKLKIEVKGGAANNADSPVATDTVVRTGGGGVAKPKVPNVKVDAMFEAFWKQYPGPRKVDKKKCREKFATALSKLSQSGATAEDAFREIMNGLVAWKKCSMWNKDNGQYIRAPLVWLNNENWKDTPSSDGTMDKASAEAALEAEKERRFNESIRKLKPEDWGLCREQCANCGANGCTKGILVPPDKARAPYPPKECPRFKSV